MDRKSSGSLPSGFHLRCTHDFISYLSDIGIYGNAHGDIILKLHVIPTAQQGAHVLALLVLSVNKVTLFIPYDIRVLIFTHLLNVDIK